MEKELEIKQFSKGQLSEERQITAGAVKEKRRQYFDRQENLSARTEKIIQEAKDSEANLGKVIDEIESINQQINERDDNTFRKFLNRFKISDKKGDALKESLAEKITTKENFEQHFQQAQELLEQIDIDKNNKAELDEAKQAISDFYQDASEKWNEYLVEQEKSKVEKVIEEYDVLIVHGIHPNFVPGENSLLNLDVDWKTKLKIALALNPNVAASTIRSGDTRRNFWSHMGIIVKEGNITYALSQDAGTQAVSLKSRQSGFVVPEKVSAQIKKAIDKRGQNGYNELNIESWQAAGFYFCIDSTGDQQRLVALDEIYQTCQELGLPLYVIKDGLLYESLYHPDLKKAEIQRGQEITDQLTNQLKDIHDPRRAQITRKKAQQEMGEGHEQYIASMLGEQVAPQEISSSQFQLADEWKDAIKQELFIDPPFKCTFPEAENINSKFSGEGIYIKINALIKKDDFLGQEVDPNFFAKDTGMSIAPDEIMKKIAEVKRVGGKPTEYFVSDKGQLYRRYWFPKDKQFHLRQENGSNLNNSLIDVSTYPEKLSVPLVSNENYLKGMDDIIKETVDGYQQAVDDNKPQLYIKFCQSRCSNLIYHLYGFGDKAKELGDNETAEAAFEIANKYLPQEEYREVVARRLDTKGRFVTTEADFA